MEGKKKDIETVKIHKKRKIEQRKSIGGGASNWSRKPTQFPKTTPTPSLSSPRRGLAVECIHQPNPLLFKTPSHFGLPQSDHTVGRLSWRIVEHGENRPLY